MIRAERFVPSLEIRFLGRLSEFDPEATSEQSERARENRLTRCDPLTLAVREKGLGREGWSQATECVEVPEESPR